MKLNTRQLTSINFIWILISIFIALFGFYIEFVGLIFIGGISLLFSSLIFIVFGDFTKEKEEKKRRS